MKKLLFFAAAICCSTILFAQNAYWMGNSYLVVEEKWYNLSNVDDATTEALPETLGSISALNIGGQVQSAGDMDGATNPAFFRFHFDDLDEWHQIQLDWFRWNGSNNVFGCGGEDPEPQQPVVAAEGFDALGDGEHTLTFYFYKPSGDTEKAPDGNLYDNKGGANYYVKFVKTKATGIDHVVGNAASLKVMENGVLYIYRNGVKYDTNGKAIR